MTDVPTLLHNLTQGDRRALARLLTLVSRGQQLEAIAAALPAQRPPLVVALTGSAGVGKSTLIGKLLEVVRTGGQRVAVLACDPQSPLTAGALLGDRFRMPAHAEDDGVFIRSLAALSHRGAIAEHLPLMLRLLAVQGYEVVLIETVGAGQGDVSVRQLADVVVLLVQPETGDDLQWEKAGVLEVADLIVVQKADLPGAELVAGQLCSTVETPVLLVSARQGSGVRELWQRLEQIGKREHAAAGDEELLQCAEEVLRQRLREANNDLDLQELRQRWRQGVLPRSQLGLVVLRWAAKDAGQPGKHS